MPCIDQDKRVSATQDNQLIEACYTMSLNEKRLLLLGISKIDPTQFPKAKSCKTSFIPFDFSLSAREWQKYYPDEKPSRAMKRASVSLLGRHLTLHPKTGIIEKTSWFDHITYHENEGRLTVRFGHSMTIRLAGMLEQFTKIDLLSINTLNSIYAIRLYELLNQFRATGYRVLMLEDFRFAMDCQRIYVTTKELKRCVLNPAIKELNEKSDLRVSLVDVTAGKCITGFKFHFSEEKQPDLLKAPTGKPGVSKNKPKKTLKNASFIEKHSECSWADDLN